MKEGEGKKYRKVTAAAKKISGNAAVSSSFIRAGWHFHLSGRRENSAEGFSQGGGRRKMFLQDSDVSYWASRQQEDRCHLIKHPLIGSL